MPAKRIQHLLVSLVLVWAAKAAMAVDTFSAANNQLSLDSVVINDAVYSNVLVTINAFTVNGVGSVSPVAATGTTTAADIFNPANNQIFLHSVVFNGATYSNVLATVNAFTLNSVGRASPFHSSLGSLAAQLGACPKSADAAVQFYACTSGTFVGQQAGSLFTCTLTIGDGKITLSTTDQNAQVSFSVGGISFTSGASDLPSIVLSSFPALASIGLSAIAPGNYLVSGRSGADATIQCIF